jgi:hypothetical protein
MELILTSFGTSHLPYDQGKAAIFDRMPPTRRVIDGPYFALDFAPLLVAERTIVDLRSYELLNDGSSHNEYLRVGETLRALHSEGFVRLVDFDSVIHENEALLDDVLRQDLQNVYAWIPALKKAVSEWRSIVADFQSVIDVETDDYLSNMHGAYITHGTYITPFEIEEHIHTLKKSQDLAEILDYILQPRKRHTEKDKSILTSIVTRYLSYVNTNLLLSNVLDAGFYDWADLKPFYADKLLHVAKRAGYGDGSVDAASKLFEISFPEFNSWDTKRLLRVLKDKRIVELRNLIRSAADGEVQFDQEFASRTLSEVLKIEESVGKLKNIVSYLTLPLEFVIPGGGLIAKGVEEAVALSVGHYKRRKHRWFYLLHNS